MTTQQSLLLGVQICGSCTHYTYKRSVKILLHDVFIKSWSSVVICDHPSSLMVISAHSCVPNRMWCIWKNKFSSIIDKHALLKTRKIGKKRTPWITKQVLLSKRNKNLLKKKALKSKDENDWLTFKSARNSHNKLIKSSIRHHYDVEIRNNNLIHKSKKSQNITDICNQNGEIINTPGIPNAFNSHFTDLSFNLSQNILRCSTPPESYIRE